MRAMPTFFLPATVTRCSGLWPCTSALGESTRSSSAGIVKLFPSSKVTVRTRLSLSSLSSVGQGSAMGIPPRRLTEVYVAFDHVVEAGAHGGQHHLHLELAPAAEALIAHHPLDLLLRGHPHLFQE